MHLHLFHTFLLHCIHCCITSFLHFLNVVSWHFLTIFTFF
jgi:hypothetical protein